jgi:UDP-N-acetylglucosamine acyltransferase
LKRRGFSVEAILDIKKGYRSIYMKENSIEQAKKELEELKKSSKEVGLYLDFIERSKRGLIRLSG